MLALEIESLFDALLSWFPVAAVLSMSSFCVWFSNVVLGDVCLMTFMCISSYAPVCQFMKIERYQMSGIFKKQVTEFFRTQKFLGPEAFKAAVGRGPEHRFHVDYSLSQIVPYSSFMKIQTLMSSKICLM